MASFIWRRSPGRLQPDNFYKKYPGDTVQAVADDFFEATATPSYPGGVLKRWSGSAWVKAKLKVYVSGSWQQKALKVWTGTAWEAVDATGI